MKDKRKTQDLASVKFRAGESRGAGGKRSESDHANRERSAWGMESSLEVSGRTTLNEREFERTENRSSYKERRENALAPIAEEGRDKLR